MPQLPDWVPEERRHVGAHIRQQRLRANLTQDEIVRRTGVDRRTVQRIESGERDPKLSLLLVIARAIGVPLGALVDERCRPPQ